MPDGGPCYCETPAAGGWLAEPWNTVSELAFLIVIVFWALRLRGQARRHWFVASALPVVFVAFVGGVLFHGLRLHPGFLLLDWVPIAILLFATVTYLFWRATGRLWAALLYVAAFFLAGRLVFSLGIERVQRIAFHYAVAAAFIAIPVVIEARRAGRGLREIGIALALIVVGTLCHAYDLETCDVLPMGTHWVWHVCAAGAVHYVLRFLVVVAPAS